MDRRQFLAATGATATLAGCLNDGPGSTESENDTPQEDLEDDAEATDDGNGEEETDGDDQTSEDERDESSGDDGNESGDDESTGDDESADDESTEGEEQTDDEEDDDPMDNETDEDDEPKDNETDGSERDTGYENEIENDSPLAVGTVAVRSDCEVYTTVSSQTDGVDRFMYTMRAYDGDAEIDGEYNREAEIGADEESVEISAQLSGCDRATHFAIQIFNYREE